MPVYETSVIIDCPQERAYEFLLRPENIAKISPPELGLAFTRAPEVLDLGCEFEVKVQAYGHVLTMVHKITELVPLQQIAETAPSRRRTSGGNNYARRSDDFHDIPKLS